jgi:hypothetical protein
MGTALLEAPRRKRRKAQPKPREDYAPPKRVDFHANGDDFSCVLLASIGLTTAAIAQQTGLTEGQVLYRLALAERENKSRGRKSARIQYRQGKSAICRIVINQLTARSSLVKKTIEKRLDRQGLYAPKPRGVMRDE